MKQHQFVVAEQEKKGAYAKIVGETQKVFRGGDLFKGLEKVYKPKAEGGDPLPSDSKKVVTTVGERLEWTEKTVSELLNFEATRDKTNMVACADIDVDGVVIATSVPVTTLLSLEKRLIEVRQYYDAIPTLDLSAEWTPVPNSNMFKNGPVETYRYVKKTEGVTLYPHTDKHPAQVKEVTNDVLVGTFSQTNYSGEVQPGNKAEWLGRIDRLIEAVKRARAKANETEVVDLKIGKAMFDYIHKR